MKKKPIILAFSFVVLFVTAFSLYYRYHQNSNELSYNYDESNFHEFYTDNKGYVNYRCEIVVKNNSNKKVSFTMEADVLEDWLLRLTKESYAFAYKNSSPNYEVFKINPNSEQTYPVIFKVLSAGGKKKLDRLPPTNIIFNIIKE
jgi:hypothetical protein